MKRFTHAELVRLCIAGKLGAHANGQTYLLETGEPIEEIEPVKESKVMRSTKLKIVRSPLIRDICLGTGPKQLEIVPGQTYELAPHADLWMRGAKYVRVKYIQAERESGDWTVVGVAPIVGGRELRGKFLIPVDHFA
jgi:hypothetical protein